MNDIETITIKRDVDVQLTDEERATLREQACAALDTADELAERRKSLILAAKEARAKAKKGTETRMLECHEEKNFRTGEVRVMTPDGTIVETRALSGDERQTKIDAAAPVVPTTGRKKKLGTAPDPDDAAEEKTERAH